MSTLTQAQLIAAIGILCQLLVDFLLLVVFLLLRRHAEGRAWFTTWTLAWAALAVALVCVTWSYFGPLPADWRPWAVPALQFVYLAGKMLFIGFLFTGYRHFIRAPRGEDQRLRLIVPFAVGYAGLAYLWGSGVTPTIIWQGVPAVAIFLWLGITLARLPDRRRSIGSVLSSFVFVLMALLWAVYILGFAPQLRPWLETPGETVMFIARNNAFFDMATHILLAFGMVLILVEEAKREVDAAHMWLDRAHRRLKDQSLRDPLTGCFNRRAFLGQVGLECIGQGGVVAVLDLDNLKQVNDTHGHAAGDMLLRHFAHLLRAELRSADSLYRWGGDEFLLVLPGARAAQIVPRLTQRLSEAPPCDFSDGERAAAAASIGTADFANEQDFDAALQAADQDMYKQKRVRKKRQAMHSVKT